jgi:polyphosphate kinase
MKRKQYQRELRRLHGELVAMQARVKASAAKVCVVFEGRDTAGEGRHHQGDHPNASARGCSVPSPCPPPPNASSHRRTCTIHTAPSRQGEVVIFDRSWYNRGGVERVMGFCPPRPGHPIPAILQLVPGVEKAVVDSGIVLVKSWLEVSQDEQTRRLQSRIDDPRKLWKLSGMDLKSNSRWYDYSLVRSKSTSAGSTGSERPRSTARCSASARRLVGKMSAERCRLPSW